MNLFLNELFDIMLEEHEISAPPQDPVIQIPRRPCRRRRREVDVLRDDLRGDLQFQHLVH